MALYGSFRKPGIVNVDSNIPLSIKKIFKSENQITNEVKSSMNFGDLALVSKEKLAVFLDGEYKLLSFDIPSGSSVSTLHSFNTMEQAGKTVNVKNGDYIEVTHSEYFNNFSLTIVTEDKQNHYFNNSTFRYLPGYRWWESFQPKTIIYIFNNMPVILRSPYDTVFSGMTDVFSSSQTQYNQHFYVSPGDIIDIVPNEGYTRNFILSDKTGGKIIRTNTVDSTSPNYGGKFIVDSSYLLKQIVEPVIFKTNSNITNKEYLRNRIYNSTGNYAFHEFALHGGQSINVTKNNTDNCISLDLNLTSGPLRDELDLKANLSDIGEIALGQIIESDYDPGVSFLRANGAIVSQSAYQELFNEIGLIGDIGPSFGLKWEYIPNSAALISGKDLNKISILTFPIDSIWYNRYFISGRNGIFYSDDGENWTWISIPDSGYLSKVIKANYLDHLIAVSTSGVFKSTNKGLNWTKIEGSLPQSVESIEHGADIIISTGSFGAGIIKRSQDGGGTWTDISIPGITSDVTGYASVSNDFQNWIITRTVFEGGAYKSTDYGLTWSRIDSLYQLCQKVERINIQENNNWIAFGENKLLKSTDNGLTWTILFTFSGTNNAVDICGYDDNWVIFTSNSGGYIYVTYDNWSTYKKISATSPYGGAIKSGFFGNGKFLCVGQYGADGLFISKKYLQYDHLSNFKLPTGSSKAYIRKDSVKMIPVIKPDIEKSISEVLLRIQSVEDELPKVGDILTTSRKPSAKYLPTNGALIAKAQYNDLFKKIGYIGDAISDGSYDPNLWTLGQALYENNEWKYPWAATSDKVSKAFIICDNTIFISTDAGLTWNETNQPPLASNSWTRSIKYINGKLFVGYDNGKFDLSLDNGNTWSTFSDPDSQYTAAIRDFVELDDNTLIIVGEGGGAGYIKIIHESDPTWHDPTSPDGLVYFKIYSIDKSDTSIISCNTGGIFRSTDAGMTWVKNQDISFTGNYYPYVKYHDGVWILIQAKKIYRSIDDGITWTEVYTIPYNFYGPFDVDENGVWMIGSQGGTWQTIRSEDNGLTWTNIELYPAFAVNNHNDFNDYDTFGILINVYPGRWISNSVFYINGGTYMYYTYPKTDYDQNLYFKLPTVNDLNNVKTYIKALN